MKNHVFNTDKMNANEKIYVDRKEAAQKLKISVRQLANLEKQGKITYHQATPRGRILYDVDDLTNYINYYKRKAKFERYQ